MKRCIDLRFYICFSALAFAACEASVVDPGTLTPIEDDAAGSGSGNGGEGDNDGQAPGGDDDGSDGQSDEMPVEETPAAQPEPPAGITLSGQARVWHPLTLTLDGPSTSETANLNPFSDYRVDVTFSQGSVSHVVPGYYAACGNAAETGCDVGGTWRVHFTPELPGTWNYSVAFSTGTDVAVGEAGSPYDALDGLEGELIAQPAADPDPASPDPRRADRGRVSYIGEHYPAFADGRPFIRVGVASPDNALAYDDFDATPNVGARRKSWSAHQVDFDPNSADAFTWEAGRGSELLGAIRYLADEGVNTMTFSVFTLGGDDQNVFPHLIIGAVADFDAIAPEAQWAAVYPDRFDVSKLDQWERVLAYADALGIFVTLRTTEPANESLMDNGSLGRERILYYRELIARFGHHLKIGWNLGKDWNRSNTLMTETVNFIASTDPYHHLITFGSRANREARYDDQFRADSELHGALLQLSNRFLRDTRDQPGDWLSRSVDAGKKWIVSIDRPGHEERGISVDDSYPIEDLPSENTEETDNGGVYMRSRLLWNALTAGTAAIELYYGTNTGCGELLCQNHRTRAAKWPDLAAAAHFMNVHLGTAVYSMAPVDDPLFRVSAKPVGVYSFPNGGGTTIAVEVEDVDENPPGDWVFETARPDFTGSGYYRWSGANAYRDPGRGVLPYVFEIPNTGAYRFSFRGQRINPEPPEFRTDLNNDIWLRIIDEATGETVQPRADGESSQDWWKMFFSGPSSYDNWVWAERLDRADDVKFDGLWDLTAGTYRLEISGRSTECKIDRWTLTSQDAIDETTANATLSDATLPPGTVLDPIAFDEDTGPFVFGEAGENYVVYSDSIGGTAIDFTMVTGTFDVYWYDVVEGGALQRGSVMQVEGGGTRPLGRPPGESGSEWVVYLQARR